MGTALDRALRAWCKYNFSENKLDCGGSSVTLNASSGVEVSGALMPYMASLSSLTLEGFSGITGTIPSQFSSLKGLKLVNLPNITGTLPVAIGLPSSNLSHLHLENLPGMMLGSVSIQASQLQVLVIKGVSIEAINLTGRLLTQVTVDSRALDLDSSNITIDACNTSVELATGVPATKQPLLFSSSALQCRTPTEGSAPYANLSAVPMPYVVVSKPYCIFSWLAFLNHTGSFRVEDGAPCNLLKRAGRELPSFTHSLLGALNPDLTFTVVDEPIGSGMSGLSQDYSKLNAVVVIKENPIIGGRITSPGSRVVVINSEPGRLMDPSLYGHVAFDTTIIGNLQGTLPTYVAGGRLRLVNNLPLIANLVFPAKGDVVAHTDKPEEWTLLGSPQPVPPLYDLRGTGVSGTLPPDACLPGLDVRNNQLEGFVPEECYSHASEIRLEGNCWWCCNGTYPYSDGAPNFPHKTAHWANRPCCKDFLLANCPEFSHSRSSLEIPSYHLRTIALMTSLLVFGIVYCTGLGYILVKRLLGHSREKKGRAQRYRLENSRR